MAAPSDFRAISSPTRYARALEQRPCRREFVRGRCSNIKPRKRARVAVDPRYTPQMCSKCGHVARGNRDKRRHRFACPRCHYRSNDDRFGVMNLRGLGIEYRVTGAPAAGLRSWRLSTALRRDPSQGKETASAVARTSGESEAPALRQGVRRRTEKNPRGSGGAGNAGIEWFLGFAGLKGPGRVSCLAAPTPVFSVRRNGLGKDGRCCHHTLRSFAWTSAIRLWSKNLK